MIHVMLTSQWAEAYESALQQCKLFLLLHSFMMATSKHTSALLGQHWLERTW